LGEHTPMDALDQYNAGLPEQEVEVGKPATL
jgi:hypothetical protein